MQEWNVMTSRAFDKFDRRAFLTGALAAGAGLAAAPLCAETEPAYVTAEREIVRRNISSFRSLDWRPYFSNTKNGAILVDTVSRLLATESVLETMRAGVDAVARPDAATAVVDLVEKFGGQHG